VGDALRLEVPPDLDGQRADRILSVMLDISRSEARALFDRGVEIDDAPVQPADRLAVGAVIESPTPEPGQSLVAEPVTFGVIHEDPALIVVDKPPGLVVHPGAGRSGGTLAAGLLDRYPELEGVGAEGRWGLVHRLDKDTSGALLVARTQDAFDSLTAALARREIGRTYTALVHGEFATETGTIDAPIGRDPSRLTRKAVAPGGKPAITHYEVVHTFGGDGLSLLEVKLETGRTHQIRVHLAAIDHPVLGDTFYGAPPGTRSPRMFLHARRVELKHPLTGSQAAYEAPLPSDLKVVLESLDHSS
jgi:23S rRNA pseudouridine1911/1915/1917 synthase